MQRNAALLLLKHFSKQSFLLRFATAKSGRAARRVALNIFRRSSLAMTWTQE
jgi:hypothetical protein